MCIHNAAQFFARAPSRLVAQGHGDLLLEDASRVEAELPSDAGEKRTSGGELVPEIRERAARTEKQYSLNERQLLEIGVSDFPD